MLAGALALSCVASARGAYDEATSFQENAGHTGFASGGSLGAPPLTQAWSVNLGGTLSAPLIGGGMTFVIQSGLSSGPTLIAISNATGAVVWTRATGPSPELAYDGGDVFVTDSIGDVVAMNGATGRRLWADTLARPISSSSIVARDGTVYVDSGVSDGGLYAVKESDGSVTLLGTATDAGLSADGRFVYANDAFGDVEAVDRIGEPRAWSVQDECAGFPYAWDAEDGARMIVGDVNCGGTTALDAAAGTTGPQLPTSAAGAVIGPAAVLYTAAGGLEAIDLVTGAQLWQYNGDVDTPPLVVNDVVYDESSGGELLAISLDTGALLWSTTVAPTAYTSGLQPGLAAAEGLLVVPYAGTLAAFRGGTALPGLDLQIHSGPDGPTDATSATLKFGSSDTAVPTSCRLDDGPWSACTSPYEVGSLADGPHTIEVRTTDPSTGATVAIADRGWSVLAAPSRAYFTATPPRFNDQPRFTISWASAGPDTTYLCSLDGAPFSACYEELDGPWPDGPHTFAVESVDPLGDVQKTPTIASWTTSTTTPTTTVNASVPNYTSSRSATFTFSADKPSTYTCSLDQAPYQTCTSPYEADNLADGMHSFAVRAKDAYGNVEQNQSVFTWTVDTTPPVTTFVSPSPSGTDTDRNPLIAFTSNETSSFMCSLDDEPYTNCRSPVSLTDLGYGAHAFHVIATDLAGNAAAPVELDWTVAESSATSSASSARQPRAAAVPAAAEPAAGTGPPPGYDEATSFQENPGHTGFGSGGSLDAPPLVQAWQLNLGGTLSAPLIAGGDVFVLDQSLDESSSEVEAINSATGSVVWTEPTAAADEMTYDAGKLFINGTGVITALDAATGATLWTNSYPTPISLSLVAEAGVLYVDAAWSGGPVSALNESDGSEIWSTPFDVAADLAADASHVYALHGGIDALDLADGHEMWHAGTDCFPGGGTATDGARVISGGGECGAEFDTASGAIFDTAALSVSPAVAGNTGVFLNGSTLQGRDLSTGLLQWQFAGDTVLDSPPLIVNDTAYDASENGNLFAVNLDTGKQVWSANTPPNPLGAAGPSPGLAAAEGVLVFPFQGTLTAYKSVSQRPGLDLQIDSGPSGATTATSATITFAASDPTVPTSCRLDGGAWAACTSPYTVTGLADGPHTLAVRTTDPTGSTVGLAVAAWSVLTAAPTAKIISAPASLVNQSTASFGFSSSDPNATFQCSVDGAPFATCGGSGDGAIDETVSDGSHTFSVRAVGELGAVQASPAVAAWTVDTAKPVTTLSTSTKSDTGSRSASFTFSANEASTFVCTLDAGPPVPCTSPYSVTALSDGPHRFSVQATDAAGNTGSAASFNWTVRTMPPTTTIEGHPSGTLPNQPVSIYFTTDDPAATFTCSLDGAPFAPCTSPVGLSGLANGAHTFRVLATDGVGNVEQTPAEVDWTFVSPPPTTPPTTTIDSDTVSPGSVTVTFHSDQSVSFRCALDNGVWLPCSSPVAYSNLTVGAHQVSVQGTNAGGLADLTPATVRFTITAPAPPPPRPPTPTSPPTGTPPGQSSPPPSSPPTGPPPTISALSLVRALEHEVAKALRTATTRQLRHGLSLLLAAPAPGKTVITIRSAKHPRSVLASVSRSFRGPGTAAAVLHLTTDGRRVLRGRQRLRVTITVSFSRHGARPVSVAGSGRIQR